jgi:5-oxoprolinase (ATP-hydrolysing)
VTDANLLLGRLIPEYFPKIFGKSEKEPLDTDASRREFEKLARDINDNSTNEFSLDEIVYGCVISRRSRRGIIIAECVDTRFIKVANETMCRPIRALTEAKGYATSSHM